MRRFRLCICLLLSVALGIFLLPSGGQAAQTVPDGWTGIFDRSDLERINTSPRGQYILMNDIDLSDAQWSPLCNSDLPFTGTFDGNGHTIYGMTVADTSEPCGLFSYIDGGTVTSLAVSGSSAGAIAGLLSGKICKGTVADCTVRGTVNATSFGGGIAGQIRGKGVSLSGCVSHASVSGTGGTDTELLLGGLCGGVYGEDNTFSSCEFFGALAPSGPLVSAGGIAGEAEGSVTFADCGIEGSLSFTVSQRATVGGIAGRAGDGVVFSRCSFRADWGVAGCSGVLHLGGICGQIFSRASVTVSRCSAYGSLAGTGHPDFTYSSSYGDYKCISCATLQGDLTYSAFVGGIVGSSVASGGTVTVSQCSSFVSVSGTGAPLVLGGVVGINRSDAGAAQIEDCYADGAVIHDAPVHGEIASACGGIAGINSGAGTAVLRRCFSACEVSVAYPLADGAVVGMNSPVSGEGEQASSARCFVENCYYLAGVRECFASPLAGAQLSDAASFAGFDFSSVWAIDSTAGFPRLISADGGVASTLAGDVDGNGRLTEYDARLLTQYLTGTAVLSSAQAVRADINSDGALTARDVSLILRASG